MSERESLKQRFAKPATEPASPKRRDDYKGERVKLTFRVPKELAARLRVLKIAEGTDQSELVVEALSRAVEDALVRARGKFDDAAWEVVEQCARRRREGD